jgi:single-stranded DNA-binding protein
MRGITATAIGAIASKELKLRTSKGGGYYTRFILATDLDDGKNTWVRVTCFDDDACRVCDNCRKGDLIEVHGDLYLEYALDKEGQPKPMVHIAASGARLSEEPTPRQRERQLLAADGEADVYEVAE